MKVAAKKRLTKKSIPVERKRAVPRQTQNPEPVPPSESPEPESPKPSLSERLAALKQDIDRDVIRIKGGICKTNSFGWHVHGDEMAKAIKGAIATKGKVTIDFTGIVMWGGVAIERGFEPAIVEHGDEVFGKKIFIKAENMGREKDLIRFFSSIVYNMDDSLRTGKKQK